ALEVARVRNDKSSPCALWLCGELKRPRHPEEFADLVRVLFAWPALDPGGDVDRGRARGADRFRQKLGGEAARQHPGTGPAVAGYQPPIEGKSIATRQRIGAARR